MSGRTIYERSHGQTIFMEGITKKCSHEKEAEWFYLEGKKINWKWGKMGAT